MNRIRQPSPALIVAVLALVAALGGTALAANPTAQTSALNKKKVKKITTKQINKLAPGLSVAHADTAGASAVVTRGVSFDSNYPVEGFTAVSRPTTGVYCLTPTADLNPSSDPAIVNVQWENSIGNDLLAYWDKGATDCPAGRYAVRTYRFPAGTPALSNDVEFLITVL